jgi:hypothetical protein
VNSIEKLRWQMQIALLVEAHREDASIPNLVALAAKYHINGDPAHLASSINRWENAGYLITYRTMDGSVVARVKPQALMEALSEVLDVLEADTFKVDWKKEEILTDAVSDELIVMPNGWKLFTMDKVKSPSNQSREPIVPGIHIFNNFSPTSQVTNEIPEAKSPGISWAGWVSVIVAIIGILMTLWLAGKI